jgi:hypothetical protein
MVPYDLLARVTEVFESLSIPFFVTGSVASIAYGEPRMTIDIDIVVDLKHDDMDRFCSFFRAEEFYLSRVAIEEAIARRSQFNIIHFETGFKIDIMIPKSSEFEISRMSRTKRLPIGQGRESVFASPEDVILRKMQYYKEGLSDKHLRDIAGILRIQKNAINYDYISHWSRILRVPEVWENIQKYIQEAPESESYPDIQ